MRYGLTTNERYEQRKAAETQDRNERSVWRKKFAWFPVTLSDGTSVWWESYWFRERWLEVNDFRSLCWPGFYVTDKQAVD
jgi:hypothetical protein